MIIGSRGNAVFTRLWSSYQAMDICEQARQSGENTDDPCEMIASRKVQVDYNGQNVQAVDVAIVHMVLHFVFE